VIQNISKALNSYSAALGMISRHGLWSYFLLPGLACVLIAGLLIGGAWVYHEELGLWMGGIYPDTWWGHNWISSLFGYISFGLVMTLTVLLFKYIALIVSAPFLGPLSEKVESIITGQPAPKFSLKDMATDTARAVRISLRNVVREIFWTLVFMIVLNFIPLIGQLAYVVASFGIQAYYAGFGDMDPALERRRYGVKQRVAFVRSHKGLAIGNGSVFVLLMFIPVVGWFLAPALGTAAATIDVVKAGEKP
jgi:CysZ protein